MASPVPDHGGDHGERLRAHRGTGPVPVAESHCDEVNSLHPILSCVAVLPMRTFHTTNDEYMQM